jgi:hypothetical protein
MSVLSGYTEDAIDRARPVNIKLLTLTDLTGDGLASITAEAFQLRVFISLWSKVLLRKVLNVVPLKILFVSRVRAMFFHCE